MTTTPAPPTRATSLWQSQLTPDAAAKLEPKIERGPLRFVGRHVLLWGLFGSLAFGGFHAVVGHEPFTRETPRAFLPLCVFGLWLGLVKWNSMLFAYARWREPEGPAERRRRPGLALGLLIGLLVAWLPGHFYLYRLDDQVSAAIREGKASEAQAEARWLLRLAWLYPLDWAHGNARHHGHVGLGLVALEQGDTAAAREHLLEAGRTPGSPQLDTFGPNMALAQALLEHGERAVVLSYFDECRDFWWMQDGELDRWSAAVRAGETPDFGANLEF
jgi:hypothetical protein